MAAPTTEDDYKFVTLKVVGGEIPGAVLAQKIGPLGIPVKTVADEIKKKTEEYKSLKVNVLLKIKDRKAEVVVTPGTGSLVLKALREPPRDRKKVKNVIHSGSIYLTDVIEIARYKKEQMKAKCLSGVIKEVLGTCVSVGCQVENKKAKDILNEIKNGEIKLPEN